MRFAPLLLLAGIALIPAPPLRNFRTEVARAHRRPIVLLRLEEQSELSGRVATGGAPVAAPALSRAGKTPANAERPTLGRWLRSRTAR